MIQRGGKDKITQLSAIKYPERCGEEQLDS
jgi:hypothetical protein